VDTGSIIGLTGGGDGNDDAVTASPDPGNSKSRPVDECNIAEYDGHEPAANHGSGCSRLSGGSLRVRGSVLRNDGDVPGFGILFLYPAEYKKSKPGADAGFTGNHPGHEICHAQREHAADIVIEHGHRFPGDAVQQYDGNIRRKDLQTDTIYNTYTRDGLPPTPIAMPGAASIDAALHPQSTKALYFVGKGDGSHEFSNSLAEHNRAVAKYQLMGKTKSNKK